MNDIETDPSQLDQNHTASNGPAAYSPAAIPTPSPTAGTFEPQENSGSQEATPSTFASQVKDKAAAVATGQKDALADQIDELANTVHSSGDQFAGKQDWIANAIEGGATELGSLATALRNNDLSSLLSQVTSLARKQPALFIGASLAAGFAVARLGKIALADVSRADLPTMPDVGLPTMPEVGQPTMPEAGHGGN